MRFQRIWATNGSACACKWELRAKMDDSKGILQPTQGSLLFSKEREHPKVDFGAPEMRFWSLVGAAGAPRMHDDTSVVRFQRICVTNGSACACKWDLKA